MPEIVRGLAVPARADQNPTVVLVATSLAILIVQIDTSVVNLALKQIGGALSADRAVLQWVIDAYNLTYASLLLTGAALGEIIGRRRMFALGILLFAAGSLVCGFATQASILIAGRAVAGLGATFMVPISLALLSAAYTDDQDRSRAVGIWASCYGIGLTIGPSFGGLLVEHVGWRSIFFLIIPVCAIAFLLAVTAVAREQNEKEKALDLPGQVLAILALGSFSFAAIESSHLGWSSPVILAAVAISAVALSLFLWSETRTNDPLVPSVMFHHSVFSASVLMAGLMTFGMYGMLFLVPLYLQSELGQSATQAGLALLPMSLVFTVVAQLSGRIAGRVGAKAITAGGMACMGIGLVLLAANAAYPNFVLLEAILAVIGVGLGLNAGPVMSVVVSGAPSDQSGMASGLGNTSRMVGATLGVAILPTQGLSWAYGIGGVGELAGAALALVFIPWAMLRKG